jgi:hypothetical protein
MQHARGHICFFAQQPHFTVEYMVQCVATVSQPQDKDFKHLSLHTPLPHYLYRVF